MYCDLFIPWQLSLSASQAASSAGRGFALFLPSSATERTTAGTTLTRPTAVRNLATHSARRTTWVHKAKDQSLREHSLNKLVLISTASQDSISEIACAVSEVFVTSKLLLQPPCCLFCLFFVVLHCHH